VDTNTFIQDFAKREADKIKTQMQGAKLFGYPADLTNTNVLIALAYNIGKQEVMKENRHRDEFLDEIRRSK
jgi:hypothetical protein